MTYAPVQHELSDVEKPTHHDLASAPRSSRPDEIVRRVAGWFVRPGTTQEWVTVLGVLIVLQAVVLGGYYTGTTTAPWDFLGAYNAEAFAWWRDGDFFDPPAWMPYQWGGYPAAASLQNSGWYLPVGAIAGLVPFTIHAATALQAFHVGWAALGTYWLARRWGQGRVPAMLGLVSYFFAVGFFSNGQHVDIVRAFAWVPWILLCASPQWFWKKPWGVPLAVLILWQAAISSYPGVLVLLAYGLVVWVVISQLVLRPRFRDYLVPLAVASVVAVLLSLMKFVPALLTRGVGGTRGTSADVFDLGVLGTLFFPYDLDFIPNDLSMRSLFLVAPIVPLMLVANYRAPLARAGGGLALAGIVLGFPWPWASLVDALPGMDLSRFQMADGRAVIGAGCVLVAVSGLEELLARRQKRLAPAAETFGGRGGARTAVVLGGLALGALAVALAAGFPETAWTVPWLVLVLACWLVYSIVTASADHGGQHGRADVALASLLVLVAALSGVQWTQANTRSWTVPRIMAEEGTWGSTSGALVAQRTDTEDIGAQRPARTPVPDDAGPGVERMQGWSGAYFSGVPSIGGNANLVGAPSFETIRAAVAAGAAGREDAIAFWEAPGIMMASSPAGTPDEESVARCVATGECGEGLRVRPVDYDEALWDYRVEAGQDTTVVFNEAYYPGMVVTACDDSPDATCTRLPVTLMPSGGAGVTLGAGQWDVSLTYETPGETLGWIAFWSGTAVVGGWWVACSALRWRQRR